jgi:RNA polymerase sigma factor (sigma-70 family)
VNVEFEDLLRRAAPRVLAALVRRYGHFETAEDAVQEALLAAATQWPADGQPDDPLAWLITVASRRLVDQLRSEEASRRRSYLVPATEPAEDDTLTLLLLCCHPSLTPASQIALTLRAVGGLTTAEIAAAFLVPETAMGQRISRAKQRIRGVSFEVPNEDRLRAVLHVLYLMFNEGYTASSGPDLHRPDLTREAIRLTRTLRSQLPSDDGEVTGLLALMLLTDARRRSRTAPDGSLVPLAAQDRGAWDHESIEEGLALVRDALSRHRVGPYQLQAAIAAVHAEAPRSEDTDWPQIVGLYQLLDDLAPNPMVTLNRAVAVGMAEGPEAGLAVLKEVDDRLSNHHRRHAVRAHLLELAGDLTAARDSYRTAARLTTSLPEQRYLQNRAAQLV